MNAPKGLNAADKKTWNTLFAQLQTDNPVEIEMAKRYVVWFNLFTQESKAVAKHGSVTKHKNGTSGQSGSFINMRQAESEMRRLWEHLKPLFADAKKEDRGLGQFGNL